MSLRGKCWLAVSEDVCRESVGGVELFSDPNLFSDGFGGLMPPSLLGILSFGAVVARGVLGGLEPSAKNPPLRL